MTRLCDVPRPGPPPASYACMLARWRDGRAARASLPTRKTARGPMCRATVSGVTRPLGATAVSGRGNSSLWLWTRGPAARGRLLAPPAARFRFRGAHRCLLITSYGVVYEAAQPVRTCFETVWATRTLRTISLRSFLCILNLVPCTLP
jgi:hypothetical protein